MDYETLDETEWEKVGRIWDHLDEGRIEAARLELSGLTKARPGHPDLRIVEAAVALEESEPKAALEALAGAERSADPAVFFHLRATAHHELARFEAARDDAARALAIRPDMSDAHDVMSRALEYLGDWDGAREHAEEAADLEPENFPLPLEVADDEFDAVVAASVSELPEQVRKHLDELPIVVEPLPSRAVLTSEDPPLSPDLLGLFVGRDLLERSSSDLPGAPGAIYLFRRNLLRMCEDRDELAKEIRVTVQHEVGHLLGLDEDDLEQWGLA